MSETTFGILITFVGLIWIWIIAFRESLLQGILCMFLPFYIFYYIAVRLKKTKIPAIIASVGFAFTMIVLIAQLKAEVAPVIGRFMEAAAARDIDAAYACCSWQELSMTDIDDFINNNHVLFDGYEKVIAENWDVNMDAGVTQGTASGSIVYADDRKRPFQAVLLLENEDWLIIGIHIGQPGSP